MLDRDLVRCIHAIFLHDGQPVTPDHAAELLGWTLDEMDKAIKWGEIELDSTTAAGRISRVELIEKATHQWPFSVIQEALGEHAVSIFPPGLLMRPLIVPVHEYADAMLDYFAAKGTESKETVLGRILDDYAAQHITELAANVAVFNDAASFMGEAKHTAPGEPVTVHVAHVAKANGRSAGAPRALPPSAPVPAAIHRGCDRAATAEMSDDATQMLIRDHGSASGVGASTPVVTAPLRRLVPYVPESPSKRRRRLAALRKATPQPVPLPPTRRNRADGVREATMIQACAGDNGSAPHLRLRGHWLSRFGFQPATRIYITPSPGQLVITVKDPARSRKAAPSDTAQHGRVSA